MVPGFRLALRADFAADSELDVVPRSRIVGRG